VWKLRASGENARGEQACERAIVSEREKGKGKRERERGGKKEREGEREGERERTTEKARERESARAHVREGEREGGREREREGERASVSERRGRRAQIPQFSFLSFTLLERENALKFAEYPSYVLDLYICMFLSSVAVSALPLHESCVTLH